MLTICWSSKGGSGTSTITAGLAALTATQIRQRENSSTTLVIDLAGDLPAIFGLSYPNIGLAEWLTRSVSDDLDELCIDCGQSVRLLSTGSLPLPEATSSIWSRLASFVTDELAKGRTIFIDAGCRPIPASLLQRTTAAELRILLILRPCYLALRRAMADSIEADGIILVTGGGRVLTSHDVESVLGIPVVAEVPLDPDIARRVDSGLFQSRLPRTLVTHLEPLLSTQFI
jgi:hypothetical protein